MGAKGRFGGERWREPAFALAALVLAALNLRPSITSVGPLIDPIQAMFRLSSTATSLLVVIPALCMGVFAPLTPALAHRFARDRVIAGGLGVIGAATLARALAPTAAALVASTLLIGAAIGIVGACVGSFVKEHFPGRSALLMGAYAASLSAGASAAAILSVPLAEWSGT